MEEAEHIHGFNWNMASLLMILNFPGWDNFVCLRRGSEVDSMK